MENVNFRLFPPKKTYFFENKIKFGNFFIKWPPWSNLVVYFKIFLIGSTLRPLDLILLIF